MVTIGVAVAIPEPWASELQDYRTSVGDATATMIPTHITLVPPTDLDDGTLAEVEKHLAVAAEQVPSFTVHLRGTGTFRPVSPVVFVTLVQGISQCELLEDQTHLVQVLEKGRQQAQTVAQGTLDDVYQRVGFVATAR